MQKNLRQRHRAFLRPWGVYYCEDLITKKQETLKTHDKDEAYRIVAARNENEEAPAFTSNAQVMNNECCLNNPFIIG